MKTIDLIYLVVASYGIGLFLGYVAGKFNSKIK